MRTFMVRQVFGCCTLCGTAATYKRKEISCCILYNAAATQYYKHYLRYHEPDNRYCSKQLIRYGTNDTKKQKKKGEEEDWDLEISC